MNFEYLSQISFMDSVDIDDIGSCCLDVFNDIGEEWILNISTDLGSTKIT